MFPFSLSVAVDVPFSIGSFKGGKLAAFYELTNLGPSFGLEVIIMVVLPGNDAQHPSTFYGRIEITSALLARFAASMAVPGQDLTRYDSANVPAWPNAFGIRGLNIYNIAFGATIVIQTGVPTELEFAAEMSLKVDNLQYVLGVAGVIGENPGNELIKIEQQNLDSCLFFTIAKAIVPQAFGPIPVTTMCAVFRWMKFDYFLFYFSTGARVANLYYPPGGLLEAKISVFGHPMVNVVGSIDLPSATASLNGTLESFSLGPLKLRGFRNEPKPVVRDA